MSNQIEGGIDLDRLEKTITALKSLGWRVGWSALAILHKKVFIKDSNGNALAEFYDGTVGYYLQQTTPERVLALIALIRSLKTKQQRYYIAKQEPHGRTAFFVGFDADDVLTSPSSQHHMEFARQVDAANVATHLENITGHEWGVYPCP